MKVIIAGSRTIKDYIFVEKAIKLAIAKKKWNITQVICGMAKGVDTLGMRWAFENNIPVSKKPADWDRHGKAAGPIRNREMALEADACIVLYDGRSPGSANMIKQAKENGLDTVVLLEEEIRNELKSDLKEMDEQEAVEWGEVLPDAHKRKALPSEEKFAKLEKRIEDLEQEVGHLKTLLKVRSSKRYGK